MGKILAPQRATLDADKVEALIFIHQNIKLLSLAELIELTTNTLYP